MKKLYKVFRKNRDYLKLQKRYSTLNYLEIIKFSKEDHKMKIRINLVGRRSG